MRYSAEHKERTRRSLLSEAAAAIRAQGPERIGVAEVMGRLGLTHGGFYAHFKSKDDLVAHAITQMFDETYAWFLELTADMAPDQALGSFIDAYLSTRHRDAIDRGCAVAALSGEAPRLSAPVRERFSAGVERLLAGVAALLKKRGNKSAEALAQSVVAELVGALVLARSVTNAKRSEQILRDSRKALKTRLSLN